MATIIVSAGVTSSGITLSSGVTMDVYGSALDTTISNGGIEYVFAGGFDSATTVLGGGKEYVSGGTAVSTTVGGVGELLVVSGGTTSFATVSGFEFVSSGGTAIDTTVTHIGELVVSGGTSISATLRPGTIEDIENGGTASFTTVDSGGNQDVFLGGTAISTTVNGGGAELISGGTASFTTLSNGGTEVLETDGAISTTVDNGGRIAVRDLAYASGGTATLNSATDVLSVTEGANSYTLQLAGSYAGEYFHLSRLPAGGTLITLNDTPCYSQGTHILTDRGEIAVEDLRVGDRVVTLSGLARPVHWIGRRHLDLRRHPAPERIQPIRIRADAIADGVPRRDLLVSPDHAILLDGVLIPVRLLINGASIEREAECTTVSYYHVELETHDILLAEALPAESYLDTGNRGMFGNADAPQTLHPDLDAGQQRRVAESCRPFLDDAPGVEPVWRRLAQRATTLGLSLPAEIETTDDPALHVTLGEQAIEPVSANAGCYTFLLPRSGEVRLVSRSARPCDLRPWVNDRRRLGVMVARMSQRRGVDVVAIPLDHPLLSCGWWDVEGDGATLWRWTDGNALLSLTGEGPLVLEIAVAGSLDHPGRRDLEARVARPAARSAAA